MLCKKIKIVKTTFLAIFILFSFLFYWHFFKSPAASSLFIRPEINVRQIETTRNLRTDLYLELHNRIISGHGEKKVVFYKFYQSGYGNSIYSLLSALMIAVLTDSAFLINWQQIEPYIDFSLNDSFNTYENKTSFLNQKYKIYNICKLDTWTHNTFYQDKDFNLWLEGIEIPEKCSRYSISGYMAFFLELATNLRYAQKLANLGFVRQETVQKASQALKNSIMTIEQKGELLLSIGFEFAGYVLNKYWHLKPYMAEKVNWYVRNKFRPHFVIGLQIRAEFLEKSDIDLFVRCALSIENKKRKYLGNQLVKWFLAIDDGDLIEEFKSEYGDRIIATEGEIGNIVYDDEDAYERALLDNELLSLCDEMVQTGGSTYGFVASLKNQKMPYYIEGGNNDTQCRVFELFRPPIKPEGYATF